MFVENKGLHRFDLLISLKVHKKKAFNIKIFFSVRGSCPWKPLTAPHRRPPVGNTGLDAVRLAFIEFLFTDLPPPRRITDMFKLYITVDHIPACCALYNLR